MIPAQLPALFFIVGRIIACRMDFCTKETWKTGYISPLIFNRNIYSLVVLTVLSETKTNENMKVQALSVSTENDPEAEHLLLDMWLLSKEIRFSPL
jgi:hypothetical protein